MPKNQERVYKFWNGKNMDAAAFSGLTRMINECARSSGAEAKYDISTETLSADDL